MPTTPFWKRSMKTAASGQGITIASDPSARGPSSSQTQKPSRTLALPPESDYRTSLIMPHLTRRFTLLRAPDGTMVTPDAMRAHLRAQRARARATGVPGTQNFLTEEEENEIIEQLRRQTRMEMQAEEEGDESWDAENQYREGADNFGGTGGFGGTDGFGRWASSSTGRIDSQIDDSLAHSLSNLQRDSNGAIHQDASAGGFFSGRSSARDHAYINEVEKSRAARGRTESSNYAHETANHNLEQVVEEADDVDSSEAMPGDFLVAAKRASKQVSEDNQLPAVGMDSNFLQVSGNGGQQYRHSQLLTNLSPEAFKRVSTALEEVYGMVAGSVGDSDAAEMEKDGQAGSQEEIIDDGNSTRAPSRRSMESDEHSFRSAQSDVMVAATPRNLVSEVAESPTTAAGMRGVGVAALSTFDSSSTVQTVTQDSARGYWEEQRGISAVTASGAQGQWEREPYQPAVVNSHLNGSGGRAISDSSTYNAGISPASPRTQQIHISMDPANGRMKRGPARPNSNTFSSGDAGAHASRHSSSNSPSTPSPLQMAFDRASQGQGGSASATAAGVAAAAYVAQHQQQQSLLQASGVSAEPSAPVTSQIVMGPAHSSENNLQGATVGRSPSSAANAVLSANAIAARSQHYFPSTSGQSMRKYADGFHTPATPNSNNSLNGNQLQQQQQHAMPAGLQTTSTEASEYALPAPGVSTSVDIGSDEAHRWKQEYGQESSDANDLHSPTNFGLQDGEGEDDDEDVWAKVARNAAPADEKSAAAASHSALPELDGAGISLDKLHEIQNTLVRSASSNRGLTEGGAASESVATSPPPLLPTARADQSSGRLHKQSNSSVGSTTSSIAQVKLEKARERARMLADRQHSQSGYSSARVMSPVTASQPDEETQSIDARHQFPRSERSDAPSTSPAIRLSSPTSHRSTRSQVLYDVTSSHRPTSPPPRGHKTSLTNLPTLQDLSLGGPSTVLAGGSDSNRLSVSLASMVEATAQAHDALAFSEMSLRSPSLHGPQVIPEETPEQRSLAVEYEEMQVEDGFGGYVTERRPILRSQSHDILSSKAQDALHVGSKDYVNQGLASPMTPNSTNSDPMGMGDRTSWSRLPGQEPYLNENLIDDVAAQAKAATQALKAGQLGRPRLPSRTKSLSRASRKKLAKTISQPQLVSTSQRLEHAKVVPRIDDTLSRKEASRQQSYLDMQKQNPPSNALQGMQSTTSSSRVNTPIPLNAFRSASSSGLAATDYRYEGKQMVAKQPGPLGHRRRSSSFGHQGQLEGDWSGSVSTPPASAPSTSQQMSLPRPSPDASDKSPKGLGRFMSRLRSRKQSEGSGLIEPYTAGSALATKSSPALSGFGTPSTNESVTSPVFVTPMQDLTSMPGSAAEANATGIRRLPMPDAGLTSLTGLFGPDAVPARTSSARNGLPDAFRSTQQHGTAKERGLGSPAVIQDGWGAPTTPTQAEAGNRLEMGGLGAAGPPQGSDFGTVGRSNLVPQSARDTIVRRTIIVSTIEPDERRKSSVPARKPSIRKPVPTEGGTSSKALAANGHRRNSSTTSNGARRSVQDRPPTPPGPDGVSGLHRRKLSQDIVAEQPLPPIARNLYEAPASGLMPPSPGGGAKRASHAASDYGASLYDMYIDRDDDRRSADLNRTSPLLHPTSPSTRQSVMEANGNATRHIEVTERADGSVVWQVIAGLADRSSSYSNSVMGGAHSRQTSVDSQYSLSDQRDSLVSPHSSKGFSTATTASEAVANEDGRSLFARTKGKHRKSFSYDASDADPLPPLPSLAEGKIQQDYPMAKRSLYKSASQVDLQFDMATPAGGAATRIVYTSDAELANMLESLAGPDKSSAKFEFQRIANNGGSTRPVSAWTEGGSRVSRGSDARETTGGESVDAESKERYRIEAEIYSLLQRDGHPSSTAATIAKQHAEQVSLGGARSTSVTRASQISS